MIIKSMSRKTVSFKQLLTYINKENAGQMYDIHHNLYGQNQAELVEEFRSNAELLKKHKNGVVLYHEILSITKSQEISKAQQKQTLQTITETYIAQRAPNNLVFAALHDNKKHNLHYHIVISSNEINSSKRLRLSIGQFNSIKQNLETSVLEQYPELEQQTAINKTAKRKQTHSAARLQHRTGALPKKQELIQTLSSIFKTANSHTDLEEQLHNAGLETYVRGKHIGVKFVETGRKHRLKTLGLQEEFSACNRRIDDTGQQAETTPPPTRETTPQQVEDTPMSNTPDYPWNIQNIEDETETNEEAKQNTQTAVNRAVEEVINEVNHDLQIAADFLRGPTLTDKEKLEAKKLEFYKREQLKQLRKQNQKTKQTSLKR
ncbi:MAG: relaxase/mobilization nuclease domain-containing protein [Rhodomicrobiaceae bacterium]